MNTFFVNRLKHIHHKSKRHGVKLNYLGWDERSQETKIHEVVTFSPNEIKNSKGSLVSIQSCLLQNTLLQKGK